MTERVQRSPDWFDKEYFESGIQSGKSLYENYRWLPDRLIEEAEVTLAFVKGTVSKKHDDISGMKIVDFGCAMGFLVKALKILGYENAYGVDVSKYAVENADPDVADKIKLVEPIVFGQSFHVDALNNFWEAFAGIHEEKIDLLLARDVLEHIGEQNLVATLEVLSRNCKYLYMCVPLGDDGKFYIPEMNDDSSHVLPRPAIWWYEMLQATGWSVLSAAHKIPGYKVRWRHHPYGFLNIIASSSV